MFMFVFYFAPAVEETVLLGSADPNFDTKDPNDHQKQAVPERLFKTLKFFDRTNDAEGAKNIAGQVMTAQRLKKEGCLEMQGNKKLDDKNNK